MHDNHYGPKIFTNLQRYALLILWHRSEKNASRFLQELRETRWPEWLGLREFPSRASMYAWRAAVPLADIRALNHALLKDEQQDILAIDGTGLDDTHRSQHYATRTKQQPKKGPKADIVIGTRSLLVHDWSILIYPRHDSHVAKGLLRRLNTRDALIVADKGYDSEELYKICEEQGNRLWAPLRNAPRSDMPPEKLPWHKRHSHEQGCTKEEYHRRSMAETVIRSLKARVRVLRARVHYMKKREFAWHILAYNLERKISFLLRLLHNLELIMRRTAPHP